MGDVSGDERSSLSSFSSTLLKRRFDLEKENLRIHEKLKLEHIDEIKIAFENERNGKLDSRAFEMLLCKYEIYLSADNFLNLFTKIDTNRDGHIDWDEFISYLILCLQEEAPWYQKQSLLSPIPDKPEVKKSSHIDPIVCLTFSPMVISDRSTLGKEGSYVSVTQNGTVHFLSEDFEEKRMGKSKNPHFKVSQTLILATVALPDVRVFCTSSMECDLRFYDTTANNFFLRISITNLPFAVSCMHYSFHKSMDVQCKLAMGDCGGNVIVLKFYPELRGPFQSKPFTAMIEKTWQEVLHGEIPKIEVQNFPNVFNEIVSQLLYCPEFDLVYASAECRSSVSEKAKSLVSLSLGIINLETKFYMPMGITTFDVDPKNLLLVTGGPDFKVRIWNPLEAEKPLAVLPGHHAGIVYVFIQSDEYMIYSLDNDKVIKVWDTNEYDLLQTYEDLVNYLPRNIPFVCFYNHISHDLVVACKNYTLVTCCPLIDLNIDGITHSKAISVVLYNKLYESVVTCGLDSCIIRWNPWTGKRSLLIKNAHTRMFLAETKNVEITAACFDPVDQLLLTGARDGTLKIWDFNSGTCIRNLTIEHGCEVTVVIWVPRRILAMGWNRHVTEFADIDGQDFGEAKNWDTLHREDIMCAAVDGSKTFVSGSYSGEIILWLLEIGQPYHKFDTEEPHRLIKLVFEGTKYGEKRDKVDLAREKLVNSIRRASQSKIDEVARYAKEKEELKGLSIFKTAKFLSSKNKFPNIIGNKTFLGQNQSQLYPNTQEQSKCMSPCLFAVKCMILLDKRNVSVENGTLYVGLGNGLIQVYSHHKFGGFINQFKAIHVNNDSVMVMATDNENKYLFTGTAVGYIKIWLLTNFCISENEKVQVSLPRLRLQFPFLLRDKLLGRAKRAIRGERAPMLLSSYRAHCSSLTSLIHISENNIVISGSRDCSARFWTLGGRYLGTLGSPLPWPKLSPYDPPPENGAYKVPADIGAVASFTTLKVLTGGNVDENSLLKMATIDSDGQIELIDTSQKAIYGTPLTEPYLGNHFRLPPRGKYHLKPVLDKTLPHIPVYPHLEIHEADPIKRPPTPKFLEESRRSEFVDKE